MAKEIRLYSPLYNFSIDGFMGQLEDAKGSDIVVRLNTPGGDVYGTFGMIAKFAEHPKKKTVKVDGIAASMGAFFCCYADSVECLDVSKFAFHRAAFPSYVEDSAEYFTDDMRAGLNRTNEKLRAAMESKFTAAKWKTVTGVSLDDLFSLDDRIDVELTAEQAKELGLVKKINPITPEKLASMEAYMPGISAELGIKPAAVKPTEQPQKTHTTMTLAELKAQHPNTYAEAVAEGAAQEKDRVEAYMEFNDVAPKLVAEGIAGGKPITQKQQAQFMREGMKAETLKAVQEDSTGAVQTAEVSNTKEPTAQQKAKADFKAELDRQLGLDKKA